MVSTSGACAAVCLRRGPLALAVVTCAGRWQGILAPAWFPLHVSGGLRGAHGAPEVVAGCTCAGMVRECRRRARGSWCAPWWWPVGERMRAACLRLMVRPWWWVCRRRGRADLRRDGFTGGAWPCLPPVPLHVSGGLLAVLMMAPCRGAGGGSLARGGGDEHVRRVWQVRPAGVVSTSGFGGEYAAAGPCVSHTAPRGGGAVVGGRRYAGGFRGCRWCGYGVHLRRLALRYARGACLRRGLALAVVTCRRWWQGVLARGW